MKRIFLHLAAALSAAVLTSCFQSATTIHLKKDGSGTVVEEMTFGEQMVAMLGQFAAMGGGGADKDPLADIFSAEKARARATTLGEGVTFQKFEPLAVNGNKGGRVTYEFADINKLKYSMSDNVKDLSPMGEEALPKEKPEPMSFAYADGKLVISLPQPQPDDAAPAPEMPDAENPEMEAMAKEMFKDMKMSLKIVADGGISDTNATHREGNTITLMEMEMGKLLEKPEMFKKLGKMNQQDPAAAIEALKAVEGVKAEAKKEVTVTLE